MISTHRTHQWKLANLPAWQWLLLDKHSFLTLYHRPKGSPVETKNSFEVSFHKSKSTLAFNDSIALCLALKVRVFGTWRWPILVLTATWSLVPYRSRLLIGSCPLIVNVLTSQWIGQWDNCKIPWDAIGLRYQWVQLERTLQPRKSKAKIQ